MIVTADWVLPVAEPPIATGAVLVDEDGRIADIGTLADLWAAYPLEPIERFDGCTIIPGLVNAHTHLSLTVLAGLVEPMPMRPFLARVTQALGAMDADAFAVSAALGALECLRNGVTCVGDIAYGSGPLAACAPSGLAGVFHIEVLGVTAEDLPAVLHDRGLPDETGACAHGRVRCGLSPHTPYTVGPDVLVVATGLARQRGASVAIHVAESPAERELMHDGTGPLAEVASRLAHGFEPPHTGSVAYLERLDVLRDALAIHCANLEPGDPELLVTARGVALCPRSNAFLHNGEPPVAALRGAGVRLALGTDSPASNHDLDLFEEARALMALDADLTADRVLEILTRDGAAALGMQDRVGTLAPGLDADLTVLRLPTTYDPAKTVVTTGGADRVEAVMTAGAWRVRYGRPTADVTAVESAATAVRATVEAALASE